MKAIALGITVCAAALAAPAAAQTSAFVGANLLGQDVPGGAGDEGASANFNGEIDLRRNRVCYYLDMDGLDDADAVHIHGKDQAGGDPPVLALRPPGPDGDEVCITSDNATLKPIADAPANFAVDVHTPDHPAGAVRGTLKK